MKAYFAKYLPVKGEVKEGECFEMEKGSVGKVLSISNNKFSCIGLTGFFKDKESGTNHVVNLRQKMQLFLCRKSIRVAEVELSLEKTDILKVMGPISPNAIWVIEGMQFTEEELDIEGTTFYKDEYGYHRERPWETEYTKEKFHLIKGPCGHFH